MCEWVLGVGSPQTAHTLQHRHRIRCCLQIIFHPQRQQYILMFHLDTPAFEVPAVGVATSPNITGQ